MSLDVFKVIHPETRNESTNPADKLGNVQTLYAADVQHRIELNSVLKPYIPMLRLDNRGFAKRWSMGGVGLGVVTPGVTPNGTTADIGSSTITVDTQLIARTTIAQQTEFLINFDLRNGLAIEQARAMAEMMDQAMIIKMIRAGLMTTSPYGTAGFNGGTTAVVNDPTDPAALSAGFARLFASMAQKRVVVQRDNFMILTSPATFYTLLQSEQVINGNYVTAAGTVLSGVPIFKMFGLPVIASPAFVGGSNITAGGDKVVFPALWLNNANTIGDPNGYVGDFTKVLAVVCSPKAIWAASHQDVTTENFWDPVSKSYYVDTTVMFGVKEDRPEYAGVLLSA